MPELTLQAWAFVAASGAIVLGILGVSYLLIHHAFAAARARHGGMTAADRWEWEQCRTLREVAVCTARWLTGELRGQPGYFGPVDVDEDEAPGLTAALIACNEVGFLTTGSQAGIDVIDGNDRWTQLAAVEGYIAGPEDDDALDRLIAAATAAGIEIDVTGQGQIVTWRNDRAWTGFGRDRADIGDDWTGYGICHPDAVAELETAGAVVVFDPEAGRNDRLLDALNRFAELSRAAEFDATITDPKGPDQ